MQYVDIHSHLNLEPLSERKDEIMARMRQEGVATITVGTGLATSCDAIAIAEAYPECFATVGIHPTDSQEPFDAVVFRELARHPKVVAIGETGLDYFRDQTAETKAKQTALFHEHIALAQEVGKPLMLHVRASKGSDDAYYDALAILKDQQFSGKANFHFFSGSKACMLDIIAAGYTVSVDGPITFTTDYDDMIRACPIESIMIETDAPFAAPKPYRGQPCEPWMVIEVAKKIAELKGLDLGVAQKQLLKNTHDFFGIEV